MRAVRGPSQDSWGRWPCGCSTPPLAWEPLPTRIWLAPPGKPATRENGYKFRNTPKHLSWSHTLPQLNKENLGAEVLTLGGRDERSAVGCSATGKAEGTLASAGSVLLFYGDHGLIRA